MGKAIIATPTDGTKELIVNGKNGLVVPFNDVQAIVDAIGRFSKDGALLSHCSEEARKVVEKRFNARRVADSVSEIYQKYLDS